MVPLWKRLCACFKFNKKRNYDNRDFLMKKYSYDSMDSSYDSMDSSLMRKFNID
jgi:hypothetical protein